MSSEVSLFSLIFDGLFYFLVGVNMVDCISFLLSKKKKMLLVFRMQIFIQKKMPWDESRKEKNIQPIIAISKKYAMLYAIAGMVFGIWVLIEIIGVIRDIL